MGKKRGQTKKSLLATMTTDQGQVFPEQQESATIIEKADNTKQLELTSTTVDGGTNPFSLLYELEQEKSTTIIEKTDHLDESPLSSTQPTCEGQVPVKSRFSRLGFIRVRKLSKYGTLEYKVSPTRSHWLEIIGVRWGTTDDKIKASIEALTRRGGGFSIEVCGSSTGHGVILRDDVTRNPIVVMSRVVDGCVSPFYQELKGVSLGLKLAKKYEIALFYLDLNCVSELVAGYVRKTWGSKYDCGCSPRINPEHFGGEKDYCVRCSVSNDMLDDIGERQIADKIYALVDDIFYDALELGGVNFSLTPKKFSKAKAVLHLAKSGVDRELKIHEIEEDGDLAEILYRDVFGHGSAEEVVPQKNELILRKQEKKLQKQKDLVAEIAYQESFWRQ